MPPPLPLLPLLPLLPPPLSSSSLPRLFLLLLLISLHAVGSSPSSFRDLNRTYKPRRYRLTLSIRNHNVTSARFFRLIGVDNTADFYVSPGEMFTNTYTVNRKGAWTLFVEFPGNRYAKSPRKLISRDSYPHWVMEVYLFPDSVGFSEWHKMRRPKKKKKKKRRKAPRKHYDDQNYHEYETAHRLPTN